MRVCITSLLVFFFISLQAQEKTPVKKTSLEAASTQSAYIKGTVYFEDETLIGTIVILKGTTIGTYADFDGTFTFPIPLKAGDVLVFSSLGLKDTQIKIEKRHMLVPLKIIMKEEPEIIVCDFLGDPQTTQLFKSKFKKHKKKHD